MDWRTAYVNRLSEFVDQLEIDLDYLEGRETIISIGGENRTEEWISRYRERAQRLRELLEAASQLT